MLQLQRRRCKRAQRCPTFTERMVNLQARNPENKYRFFPTDDPRTWEATENTSQQANNQDATWHDGHQWRGGWAQGNGSRSGAAAMARVRRGGAVGREMGIGRGRGGRGMGGSGTQGAWPFPGGGI